MSVIRCIIIDDEPWAIDLLKSYIKKIPYLELLYASESPVKALDYVAGHKPDLVFLDIRMPELTGLQIMEILGKSAKVIVTTAYSEYALDGYEHNIVDYLVKPIEFSRFFKASERAKEIIAPHMGAGPNIEKLRNYLFVKTDGRLVKVNFDDILFIEGLKDYIAIHTRHEKLISLDSLLNMAAVLPSHLFIRTHKSYIVSIDKIQAIERNRIMIAEHFIPIGDQFKVQLLKMIGKA